MTPDATTDNVTNDDGVIEGPDLNKSKTPFDKKLYRQVLLPNGLRAVLISDTVAMTQSYNTGGILPEDGDDDADDFSDDDDDEKEEDASEHEHEDEDEDEEEGGLRDAAAAMVVGVGSMYDPPECQGMAHFLEHLLFMGSKKYPEENAYDSFMSKHGGSDNAFTELEHTVYHFEIPQEHLPSALDMFAQFFTHPLLLENSVERELKSIESEFQLVKNSDNCRAQHLMCHTSGNTPEQHPFAKFSWGNLQSLKV
jgi:nardilysin